MNCPICKIDLSPLDFVSRTEHVDLCVENGPAILDYTETGQAVVQKIIPPNKQRKICPICDKTFQTIHTHYKKCALKSDLLPDLMLDHWDQLNKAARTTKKFPPSLLEGFIARRIKEGRAGEQVEYARCLLASIADIEPATANVDPVVRQQTDDAVAVGIETGLPTASTSLQQQVSNTTDRQASSQSGQQQAITVNQVLMQTSGAVINARGRRKPPKKFRMELVDDVVKRVNIDLRRERELAASAERRFDRIQATIDEQDESSSTQEDGFTINWLDRLT